MRRDYLGALASRTLGLAPLLRPTTPSRFEPDRPLLESTGLEQVVEAEAAPSPATSGSRVATLESAPAPDQPTPAPVPQPSPRLSAGPTPHPATDLAAVRSTLAGPEPLAERTETLDESSSVLSAAALRAHRETGSAWVYAPEETAADEEETLIGTGNEAFAALPARPEPLSVSSPAAATAEGAPAKVTVHIGRIEVRAVHTPAPVIAAPSPRPVAQGASLADQLQARDRGRR